MHTFKATIEVINGNPYVHVPQRVLQTIFAEAKKEKSPIPVHGTINGKRYIQTLVRYAGDWRLYINGIMFKAASVGVGDTVHMTVDFDPKPRVFPMPKELRAVLNKHPKAQAAYNALPPYRKKEICRYLGFMKTQKTLDKNVQIILAHLLGKKPKGLHALLMERK